MTAQTRNTLKALWQDGEQPDGSKYADWIDSMVSIADATAQTITSDVIAPKFIATTEVSSPLIVATEVSASTGNFMVVNASAISVQTLAVVQMDVSATAHFHGNVIIDGALDLPGKEFGEVWTTVTAAVSASAVYVELLNQAVTSEATYLKDFTVSAGLVYGGGADKVFRVLAEAEMVAGTNNTETFMCVAVDGSCVTKTESRQNIGTSDAEIVTHGLVQLSPGERLSMLLKGDDTGAKGWDIKHLHLVVTE